MSDSDVDYQLLGAQVRAARALLGWSQVELINRTKCGRSTLIDLESGKRKPHEATLYVIMSTLTGAGITFTIRGVEFREWPHRDPDTLEERRAKEPEFPMEYPSVKNKWKTNLDT